MSVKRNENLIKQLNKKMVIKIKWYKIVIISSISEIKSYNQIHYVWTLNV